MTRPLNALLLVLALAACGGAAAVPGPPAAPEEPAPEDPAPPQDPASPKTCGALPSPYEGLRPTTTLHVAPHGDDVTGDGTEASPFATVGRALAEALPGTAIQLHPGTYAGTIWIEDLHGQADAPIWIGGRPGVERPRITGGTEGLHLVRPRHVVLHDLVVSGAAANGINVDDGGEIDDPEAAHDVLLTDLLIEDIGEGGNHDGLKLSGLRRYVVRNTTIRRVASGSGIDHVGCHEGTIHDCTFEDMGSNAIQCKGGTADLLITRSTFVRAGERAINIGGSTGFAYFRPPLSPTSPNAEARRVRVVANLFGDCTTPFAFVGAVDCLAAHNTVHGTTHRWLLRILQETTSRDGFVFEPARDCRVANNLFHFRRAALSTFVNVGPGTAPETFTFTTNLFYAPDDPAASHPDLPGPTSGTVSGLDPFPDAARAPRLSPQSPAAGAGTPLLPAPADHDGRCYAAPPAIGAFAASD